LANLQQNVASDIVPGKVLSSKSGTLAYLAPEVYAGNGYDVRADWWSLGVLFYECIYNKRPFEGNSEKSLSETIQAANPKYPITQPPVSLSCLYAIGAALEPNPDKRMGRDWKSFVEHDFFKVFDFNMLERKQIEPVFVPSSEKTNFDATYDLEELLLEEAPLEARARRQKPREKLKDDATEKEIREDTLYRSIETDFRPFDYTLAAYKKYVPSHGGSERAMTDECRITAGEGVSDEPQHDGPRALTTDEATPSASPYIVSQDPMAATGQHSGVDGKPIRPQRAAPPLPTAYQTEFTRKSRSSTNRIASSTGGVQMTLDGSGSWSELARQDATLPADANAVAEGKGEGSGGMFGFLKSKKGRNHSPRPKERGVLGKEGARVVIG
jgi:serine/threonine kinase 32